MFREDVMDLWTPEVHFLIETGSLEGFDLEEHVCSLCTYRTLVATHLLLITSTIFHGQRSKGTIQHSHLKTRIWRGKSGIGKGRIHWSLIGCRLIFVIEHTLR